MKRPHDNRTRIGGVLLAAVLGALAVLALPALGHNGDGPDSPRPAGTVESFDPASGELVVDLAEDDTISGLVVRRTRIRCGEGRHHRRGEGQLEASASRRGEAELGDDRGDAVDDDEHVDDHRCGVDDLVPGAVVMKAEIVLTHGKALYGEIGLLPPQFAATA